MSRYLIHFALWMVGVPWLACLIWLWWGGVLRSPNVSVENVVMSLFTACFGALYGVVVCLVITFPLSVMSCVLFGFAPRIAGHRFFQGAFPIATSLIGLLWAQTTASSLTAGREEYALLTVGFLAGLTLGSLTVRLWNTGRNAPKTEVQT
jgi:hypothetical protein